MTTRPQSRVLMIEDDASICKSVRSHLEREGFSFESTPNGIDGLAAALTGNCDLVLLDLGVEGLSGIELCRRLRAESKMIPIIILTSRAAEIDRVLGLELGADDYVTKPFSLYELTARIRAQLRRLDLSSSEGAPVSGSATSLLRIGDLRIDLVRRRVSRGDEQIELTPKEFDVLVFLAREPGRAFTREELLEGVWNLSAAGYADTVGSLILRLRRKIETNPEEPQYILTVRGVGYRFAEPNELAAAEESS